MQAARKTAMEEKLSRLGYVILDGTRRAKTPVQRNCLKMEERVRRAAIVAGWSFRRQASEALGVGGFATRRHAKGTVLAIYGGVFVDAEKAANIKDASEWSSEYMAECPLDAGKLYIIAMPDIDAAGVFNEARNEERQNLAFMPFVAEFDEEHHERTLLVVVASEDIEEGDEGLLAYTTKASLASIGIDAWREHFQRNNDTPCHFSDSLPDVHLEEVQSFCDTVGLSLREVAEHMGYPTNSKSARDWPKRQNRVIPHVQPRTLEGTSPVTCYPNAFSPL